MPPVETSWGRSNNTLAPARTKLQLLNATARLLRSVQRQPVRIRKYFEWVPFATLLDSSLMMPDQ